MFPSFTPLDTSKIAKSYEFKDGYSSISQNIGYALIQENLVTLVDVRTKTEFESGHIKGAINIPSEIITNNSNFDNLDKNKPILLYCRSGKRAINAGHNLVESGYKCVLNMGGILSWKHEICYDN